MNGDSEELIQTQENHKLQMHLIIFMQIKLIKF